MSTIKEKIAKLIIKKFIDSSAREITEEILELVEDEIDKVANQKCTAYGHDDRSCSVCSIRIDTCDEIKSRLE